MKLGEDLLLSRSLETDARGRKVRFATGEPVTFAFTRNTEPAPRLKRGFEDRYAQRVEPSGRYMQLLDRGNSLTPVSSHHMVDDVHFQSPLVLLHVATTNVPEGWKMRLSRAFGNKKREALSRAIVAAGFDAVVTIGHDARRQLHYSSEIVDLTMFT